MRTMRQKPIKSWLSWVWFVSVFLVWASGSRAQTNRFFYDNLGRLAVIIGTNATDAGFYNYDAVGNITNIVRQTIGPVNLFIFSPERGGGNETTILQGTGFHTTPTSNTVRFGSITAQVVSATANQLTVIVPTNVVNSQISVLTPSGGTTNTRTFSAEVIVYVSPSSASVAANASTQLVAQVYGTTNQNVTWNLNGWIPAGSNTTLGTVSTGGLYTAPANPPPGSLVTVRARSITTNDPLNEGVANITVTP